MVERDTPKNLRQPAGAVVTLAEAARRCGVSHPTAKQWFDSGRLRGYAVGKRYFVLVESIEQLQQVAHVRPAASPDGNPMNQVLLTHDEHLRLADDALSAEAALALQRQAFDRLRAATSAYVTAMQDAVTKYHASMNEIMDLQQRALDVYATPDPRVTR